MFADYVYEKSEADYYNKILLIDADDLYKRQNYTTSFSAHGFDVVLYEDDLAFRISHTKDMFSESKKLVVIAKTGDYVPYDVFIRFHKYEVSLQKLFPKLNADELTKVDDTMLDLLSHTYPDNFEDLKLRSQTRKFLQECVYEKRNVKWYLSQKLSQLMCLANNVQSPCDWFTVAEEKARLDLLAIRDNLDLDTSEINRKFQSYVLTQFGKLSQELNKESPVLVSKAMEYMHDYSDKFIIIVMDGMSEFDWTVLSSSFTDIDYVQAAIFAMIPSTTPISRQCLLANKYPVQLIEPWNLTKEKAEFITCARSLGYAYEQIAYERGYDASVSSFTRCGAVIINDVDDAVHAQKQGRTGMYQDISLLAKQGKLSDMVRRFQHRGFDIYITSDHGNTASAGLGRLKGSGVEVATRSHKMVVLKDFADKERLIQKYGLIEYPKYYLPKDYTYLICDVGKSLDIKGEAVMTHGGISLDEVVVPFIKIKAVQNNG